MLDELRPWQRCFGISYFIHARQMSLATRYNIAVFLPRDAMHKRGLCRRAVSVRPSVTFVYSDETSKHIFNFFTVG